MRAGNEHLRAAGGISDLDDIDLDAVALFELLGLDALIGSKHCLGKLTVGGDADGNTACPRLDMRDDTGEDLMLLGGELLIDDAALRLADALEPEKVADVHVRLPVAPGGASSSCCQHVRVSMLHVWCDETGDDARGDGHGGAHEDVRRRQPAGRPLAAHGLIDGEFGSVPCAGAGRNGNI